MHIMRSRSSGRYLLRAICSLSTLLSADIATKPSPARAQILSDGSFNTLVNQSATESCIATVCEITGGQLNTHSSLLLHSFEQFSLPASSGPQSALFLDPGVNSIVVRVTGDSSSFINGGLAASPGSTANLFFVNPQGISFGPGAHLALGGDFTASTASEILFDNGSRLAANAATPTTPALLTVSQPIGLGFLADSVGNATSASITVSSTGNLLLLGSRSQPNAQFVNRQFRQIQNPLPPGFPPFSALSVQPNQSIRLVGNGVSLTGGNLIAEGGNIEIGSVEIGEVGLDTATASSEGTLNYGQVDTFSDIALSSSASLDVSAPNPGQIFLASRNLSVGERSAILAETLASTNNNSQFTGGGLIDIQSTGLVQVSDFPPGTPGLPFFSYLSVDAAPGTVNPGGLLNLQAQNLTVTDGAQLGANAFGSGQAGTLQLTVDDTINLIGLGSSSLSGIYSSASLGTGDAGRIMINAGALNLQAGGSISVTSETVGASGDITIEANSVLVEGTTPLIEVDGTELAFESTIQSDNSPFSTGTGGDIKIEADQVLIDQGGEITAGTNSSGDAGSIDISADSITVSGESALSGPGFGGPSIIATVVSGAPTASGKGGTLSLNSRQLSVLNGGQITTGTLGAGSAGDLTVESDSILIAGSGSGGASGLFAGALQNSGNGGNLNIRAETLEVINGGTISVGNFSSLPTSPTQGRGDAGDLRIDAREIALRNGARLNADTAVGDRGNITLTTRSLALRNGSRITTNATGPATGGNIDINASSGFIVAPLEENSDITANAEFGSGGQVNIIAQNVLGIAARPTLTSQSDITASSEFGTAGETRLATVETEIREEPPALPQSTQVPTVAQGCDASNAGRFVQTGRGGIGTTPYGILNSRNSLPDVSLPSALAADSAAAISSETASNAAEPNLTEAKGWATNTDGEVVLFVADTHRQENARCLNWQS